MKRCRFFSVFLGLVLLAPVSAAAGEITDVSVNPPAMVLSQESPQPGADVRVYAGTLGTTYDFEVTVDSEPLCVVITGGLIVNTNGQAWTYDPGTQKVTFQVDFTGFLPGVAEFGPVDPFSIGLVWSTGPEGAPAQMQGCWMDVNVLQWGLIPPEEDNPAFGYTLSGPSGQTGRFRMFIPDAVIDLLAQLGGDSSYTAADLAVFSGNSQASLAVSEVTSPDGILVDLNVPFTTAVDLQTPPSSPARMEAAVGTRSISKQISVREAKPLSMAAKAGSVKRGKKANLFGFPKGGQSALKVTLQQKAGTRWINVRSARTNSSGMYTFKPQILATTSFRALAKINGKSTRSNAVRVKATK